LKRAIRFPNIVEQGGGEEQRPELPAQASPVNPSGIRQIFFDGVPDCFPAARTSWQ
jgi:hypothetical protein